MCDVVYKGRVKIYGVTGPEPSLYTYGVKTFFNLKGGMTFFSKKYDDKDIFRMKN